MRRPSTARHRRSDALKAAALVLSLLISGAAVGGAPVLKGSVELSTERTTVDQHLAPGNKFDSKYFGKTQKQERWSQIPDWLAGSWQQRTRTRTHNKNEVTGTVSDAPVTFPSMRTIKKGFQRSGGKTWDYYSTGMIEQVAGGNYTTYSYLLENDPVASSDTKMVAFRCTINVCVNNQTQKIQDTYQTEEIESFINEKPGIVRNELSMRTFEMSGKPRSTLSLWSSLNRLAPFEATAQYDGLDMQSSLRRYLTAKAKSASRP